MKPIYLQDKYTEDEREIVFVMRYVEERSLREIAEYLKIPMTSVSSILRRDLIRLKKYSAALKHKRVNKLNVARDKSISLMLSCLNHIEKKLDADENGDKELETWEVISFTRVLQGTIKVLDDAEAMRAGKESDAGSYGSMKKAQTIDSMSIAALPNEIPEELEIDLSSERVTIKPSLVDDEEHHLDDETYENYDNVGDDDADDMDKDDTDGMTPEQEDREMKQMMMKSSRPIATESLPEKEFSFL